MVSARLPCHQERNAITICTNDVSGRSTPAAVSYDGKLRHVGVAWRLLDMLEGEASEVKRQRCDLWIH